MPVQDSEVDDEEDFGEDGYVSEPKSTPPKRRNSNNATRGKGRSDARAPSLVKRTFAVLGIALGVGIVLFGAYGLAKGHMRAGRAIGGGLVLASVSFGWLLGNSN